MDTARGSESIIALDSLKKDHPQRPYGPFEVAISPDGQYIASLMTDHYLCLWTAHDGKCVSRVPKQLLEPDMEDLERSMFHVFTDDSQYLVSGSEYGAVYIMNIRDLIAEGYRNL